LFVGLRSGNLGGGATAQSSQGGRARRVCPRKPYTPPATPPGKINTTDPDSRNVKTPRGWVQGYNAQAATNEQQIVIAAELTNSSADFGQIEPMVSAVCHELRAAGVAELPEVVLADAGYWHQAQMQALAGDGIGVLIPPDANKRKAARPGWDGGLYAFMRRVLTTPTGAELYRKRTAMIEPVFADTKFNREIDRFQRRGRAACRSEWRLITATHGRMWAEPPGADCRFNGGAGLDLRACSSSQAVV
jgi:Transposase DDE domain